MTATPVTWPAVDWDPSLDELTAFEARVFEAQNLSQFLEQHTTDGHCLLLIFFHNNSFSTELNRPLLREADENFPRVCRGLADRFGYSREQALGFCLQSLQDALSARDWDRAGATAKTFVGALVPKDIRRRLPTLTRGSVFIIQGERHMAINTIWTDRDLGRYPTKLQ